MKQTLSIIFTIFFASTALAEHNISSDKYWEVTFNLGTTFSKNETLDIKHEDGDVTIKNAQFDTKPFDNPVLYGLRISKWNNGRAWEFEHIHQKIYVENLPDDVNHFELTDGYNLFFANRAWYFEESDIILRLGAGFVVVHPEVTVHGKTNYVEGGGAIPAIWDTSSGYQWAGIAAQIALEKEFHLGGSWYFSTEAKLSTATADIDLEGGSVTVPNTALHFYGGIKYKF